MHHKKRRPKNRRAGCKLCRPWKINGAKENGRQSLWNTSERRQIAGHRADERNGENDA